MIRAPKCSCGGQLRKVRVDTVELAPLFGLRGVLEGPVPGLRCDRCGEETFEGRTLDRMLVAVARAVLAQPRILAPEEARFLRKAVLGLTQERLSRRMGINPITVADWERGERPLSKEHDYELRGIGVSTLFGRLGSTTPPHQTEALSQAMAAVLAAPRLLAPPKRPTRYVISAAELAAA
ncbi:MAG TPA: helix-turn-helix domain-containing protein [Polyangia bacterium]|jgi:DNA-binding transcriptional regulator YiaG